MYSVFCSTLGCRELALLSCSCSESVKLCQVHMVSHVLIPGNHLPSNLSVNVPDHLKRNVQNYLSKIKLKIEENITKVTIFSERIIKLIKTETKLLHDQLCKDKSSVLALIKSLQLNSKISKEVFEDVNNSKELQLGSFISEIESLSEEIRSKYILHFEAPAIRDDEFALVFKKSNFSQIDLINLDCYRKTVIGFQDRSFGYFCGCVKYENSKFFVYGGYQSTGDNRLGTAQIIDFENKKVDELPSSTKKSSFGLCLYQKCVYCFGGWNGAQMSSSQKFDLESKVWTDIQPLPKSSSLTTATVSNSLILISGYYLTDLIYYNPSQNTYTNSKYPFKAKTYKYLFENWVVCFEDHLYEIEKNGDLIKRQSIKKIEGDSLNSSCGFRRGKNIYFVLNTPELYCIKTDTKTIECISLD